MIKDTKIKVGLVEELDIWVNFTDPANKQTRRSGLTIHYSPTKEKWTVMYGLNKSKVKHIGFGDTIEEALQDKLNKLNSDAE